MKKIKPFRELFYPSLEKTLHSMCIAIILLILGILQAQAFAGNDVKNTIIDRKVILVPDYLTSELQQKQITGTITDNTGNPLVGVTVQVKGTTTGVITDAAGKYSLINVPENATLIFSFVGMGTQEIPLNGRIKIDVVLNEEAIGLQEVVIIGYGTRMKESLTGSISSINTQDIGHSIAASVVNRMQGKVSGVTLTTSAYPGASATVRIRGMGSIRNNDPLYVVDGFPGGANNINPNDIESISILKDASSTAIYGTRGANGVVLITTKRGKKETSNITFSARSGINIPTAKYDLLNTKEYGELYWLEAKNRGAGNPSNDLYKWGNWSTGGQGIDDFTIPDYVYPAWAIDPDYSKYDYYGGKMIIKANKVGTDWIQAVYQKSQISEFNLEGSGGGKNSNYSFAGGYLNEGGILKWTGFERYTLRANSDIRLADWLTVGETLGAMFSNYKGAIPADFHMAINMQPICPVYDVMGNFAGGIVPTLGAARNPVAQLYNGKDNFNRTLSATGNFYITAKFLKYFSATSKFGFLLSNNLTQIITRQDPYNYNRIATVDALSMSSSAGNNWDWANTLNFERKFGKNHVISAVAGIEASNILNILTSASRSQYFSNSVDYMYLSAGQANIINSGSGSSSSLFSIFGRVNYDLMNKYMLQATFRRDGSSRFGPAHRYGNFPAFSVGWKIAEENFMAGTRDWLDQLTMRFGWGTAGNDNIGDYSAYSTYNTDLRTNAYPITGSNTSSSVGFDKNIFGNPDVSWETTKTTNLGIDWAIFNKSLTLTVDIWKRSTSDMLYQLQQPAVIGLATLAYVNIGDMENKGFDLELGYGNTLFSGDFRYNVKANISHYHNEIMKLSNNANEVLIGSGWEGNVWTRAAVGRSFPEFWGYIVDGIFQTQAEADAYPKAIGATGTYNKPGHFKFRDINGDKVINTSDMTWIGSPHPKLTGGLNIDLGYKNFDLNIFLYGSYGNKTSWASSKFTDFSYTSGNRSKNRLYNSWGSPYLNDNADAILPIADLATESMLSSSFFIKDGSFLRLQNLQLGYNLPGKVLSKLKLSNLNIYVQLVNLFTFTKYPGLDPELNITGIQMGIDEDDWPHARQIMFGVSLKL